MRNDWEEVFIDIVGERFQELKIKNKRFSLRAFAKMAEISPGAMSTIINRGSGWSLSLDRALVVLKNIKANTERINLFISVAGPRIIDEPGLFNVPPEVVHQLKHISVYCSFGLSTPPTFGQISAATGLDITTIEAVCQELCDRGYLEKVDDSYRMVKKTGGGFEPLELKVPQDIRKNGLIFSGNANQMRAIQKEINSFYQRVYAIMNASKERNEVFHLTIDLLPLKFSKTEGNEKTE